MSQALQNKLKEVKGKALKPAPRMTLVEWADSYRYLSSKSSAFPGRWVTDRVEPARGPMLAMTDSKVKRITIMSCSQLMKSEFLNNVIGYHIHLDPAPIIMMQPTISMAQSYSKDRIDPMIQDTPVLKSLVVERKSRDSGNTILHKAFPGGQLTLVGSNSPSELASRPVRIVLADECSRYPASAGDEGDPVNLIVERTATFFNSKIIMCSTPTIADRCRIEYEYNLSDKRVFCAPCPKCGVAEELVFDNVKWENDNPSTATYECPNCKYRWSEVERRQAISKGIYRATAPFNGHAGFKVNKIASPWEPLSILVQKFIEAKKDQEKLKTFINTQLAETWHEKGDAPDFQRLYERRETYRINTCPKGVVFLTAGVDVQKDRIEMEIVGWGPEKESWSIDYRVFVGETSGDEVWKNLDKVLQEQWQLANGESVSLRVLAIDSGYNTQHVYNWARRHPPSRVMVIKGQDNQQSILGIPKGTDVNFNGSIAKAGIRVWPVGVSVLKSELYSFLNQPSAGNDGVYPSGYCHFPEYSEEFFKQLTGEQLIKRTKAGRTIYQWMRIYRNEVLDARNYARAAATMIGIDRFTEENWIQLDPSLQRKTEKVNKDGKTEVKLESGPTMNKQSIWNNNRGRGNKGFW